MTRATRDNLPLLTPRRSMIASGFSLVEVLIMSVVLVIASAVVVPLMGSGNYSVARAGARRLASDFQYAQDTAISTQKDITVTFDIDAESYLLSNESGPLIHPITNSEYTTDFGDEEGLAQLDIVKFSGGGSVTFDSSGVPNQSGTVTLRAGESSFYVTVSSITGMVTVTADD
jgi:Tfp pilus assembly protein FimT